MAVCSSILLTPAWAVGPGSSRDPVREDDSYAPAPYAGFAEFDQQRAEEESDLNFFKFGRFFGLSLGSGFADAFGNRGKLWGGGFPTIEFKVHVWLDLQLALALGVMLSSHNYSAFGVAASNSPGGNATGLDGDWNVNLSRYFLDLRYYIDTRNLSAALTFANPYILGTVGSYRKTETNQLSALKNADSALGLGVGLGFEFPISPRKLYATLETRVAIANFDDSSSRRFDDPNTVPSLPNLRGAFYSLGVGLLFTW